MRRPPPLPPRSISRPWLTAILMSRSWEVEATPRESAVAYCWSVRGERVSGDRRDDEPRRAHRSWRRAGRADRHGDGVGRDARRDLADARAPRPYRGHRRCAEEMERPGIPALRRPSVVRPRRATGGD